MKKYRIEIYNLDIVNKNFTRILEVISFKNLRWSNKFNGVGALSFDLSINDKIVSTLNFQRYIKHVALKEYQNDIDNTGRVLWFGAITSISESYEGIMGSTKIEANSKLYDLNFRYTDQIRLFKQIEQATILWTLIDESQNKQNGWLGIIQGNLSTGVLRDRTYEYGKIKELITNMSDLVNGCDFTFDTIVSTDGKVTGVQFNTNFPSVGVQRNDLPPLKIGENVQSFTSTTRGDILNSIIGIGSGTGSTTLISSKESSDSELGNTRHEDIFTNKDVSQQSALNEETDAYLNNNLNDGLEIRIKLMPNKTPLFTDFILGDYLKLKIQKGITNVNRWGLVNEINCSLSPEGAVSTEIIFTNQ